MLTRKIEYISLLLVLSLLCNCNGGSKSKKNNDSVLASQSEYLVVFGDLQSYTLSSFNMRYYDVSISWIIEQLRLKKQIRSVLIVGDITETNSLEQWSCFRDSSYPLAKIIPIYSCTGNHDYEWDETSRIHSRSSTHINSYAHFPTTDSGIVSYYQNKSLENYVARLNINNYDLYLLVLEFGPREEVISWAKRIVEEHSDSRFILLTHEWLTSRGHRISKGSSYAEAHFHGFSSYNTPEDIWNTLVKPNDNILCVICGHNGFSAKLLSENDAGRQVPQILFNLQSLQNGGNGLIQIWEFPEESDFVNVCAFDTKNSRWFLPDSTAITFKIR